MDYRNMDNENMDSRFLGNSIYCDLCFRRCRGVYHVIEKGDTLYSLGQRYRVSVSDIMRSNPYVNVYNLRIGDELCIPVKRPQPRMNDMNDMSNMGNNIMPAVPDSRNMAPEMGNAYNEFMEGDMDMQVEEEEIREDNRFTEDDSVKDVLDKMGISMSDFMKCVTKKTD